MRAMASTASPLGFPLRSHFAMVTRAVFRIRLTFHDFSCVITTRPSPSGAAQIAVGLGRPSLVNVVSRMYSLFATSAKVTGTYANLAGFSLRGRPRFPAAPAADRPECLLQAAPTCRDLPPPAGVRPCRAAPTDWT